MIDGRQAPPRTTDSPVSGSKTDQVTPDLLIRIKKKTDGSAAMSCIRADGSTTWQQQNGHVGLFFPLHDLTHYAVESVLELRGAFFGLVADGWDLSDFGSTGSKGRIPGEAGLVELIVGYFDLERRTGALGTAAQFNANIQEFYANDKTPSPPYQLTEDQVRQTRRLRDELISRWKAVPAGDALELDFSRHDKPVAVADTNPRSIT